MLCNFFSSIFFLFYFLNVCCYPCKFRVKSCGAQNKSLYIFFATIWPLFNMLAYSTETQYEILRCALIPQFFCTIFFFLLNIKLLLFFFIMETKIKHLMWLCSTLVFALFNRSRKLEERIEKRCSEIVLAIPFRAILRPHYSINM